MAGGKENDKYGAKAPSGASGKPRVPRDDSLRLPSPGDDERLFLLFRERMDEAAMETLIERYSAGAYSYAMAVLGDEHSAEDAVQDAILRMIRARHTFCPGRPFARWFYGILRNVCRDEMGRRRRAEPASGHEIPEEPDEDADPAIRLEIAEDYDLLKKALGLLTPDDREILALRFARGLEFRDVAAILEIGEEAAKKRVQRALKELRRQAALLSSGDYAFPSENRVPPGNK
jgi:RNA polymerase sigma-70 factor (ECF subfamily)